MLTINLYEQIKTEDFKWNGQVLTNKELDLVIDALEEMAHNDNPAKFFMLKQLFDKRYGEEKRFNEN